MSGEWGESFACFGATCAVFVTGDDAAAAVARARRRLLEWDRRFTRFDPASELSRLNADRRHAVPVSATLAQLARAAVAAAEMTDGLVDSTLVSEIERAGYRSTLRSTLPLPLALRRAPARKPASGRAAALWRELKVEGSVIHRPPGLALDSGGLGKGLFADLLAGELAYEDAFAVECAGDLRVGGTPRQVHVASPFGGPPLHTFRLADAAAATSGIGRRSWLDAHGRPAHHLLDPSTGTPAFTGVVQATAIAPTAVEAEIRAKAAVLSGPDAAASWLPHGGVIVDEDGRATLVESSTLGQQTQAPSPEMIGGCAAPCW
jgi:FAD:protein FMN transferase